MERQDGPLSLEAVLTRLTTLAPRQHQELLRGMVAELGVLTDRTDRIRFAMGAWWAVLRLTVVGGMAPARMAFAGASVGVLVALLDMHASGTCLLAPLAAAAGALFGSLAPRNAWRWAAAILVGLVVGSTVTPQVGFLDRTDVLSLLPLLLIVVHVGAIARRLVPRASQILGRT